MSKKAIRHGGPCPIERVLAVFAGKWKPAILFSLENGGTLRFNELRRQIPGISQRMLTQQLRELERDGVVAREQFLEIPPRVEYRLTPLGSTLSRVEEAIDRWGQAHMPQVEEAREHYDLQRERSAEARRPPGRGR
ncbi:MAG: helix-turn-helix domain-containing protein [Acidobacteriota bacterium]